MATYNRRPSYDPSRSQVTDTKLADFVEARIEPDLTSVPGVGARAVEVFNDLGIHNTMQLIGKFLMLREADMDTRAHCNAFMDWLYSTGQNSHVGSIVRCIASKVNTMIPGIYNERDYETFTR